MAATVPKVTAATIDCVGKAKELFKTLWIAFTTPLVLLPVQSIFSFRDAVARKILAGDLLQKCDLEDAS